MDSTPLNNILSKKYHVISVEASDPPEGMPPGQWHHYIIGRGTSNIDGFRNGSLQSVSEHAHSVVEELNARAVGKKAANVVRKK